MRSLSRRSRPGSRPIRISACVALLALALGASPGDAARVDDLPVSAATYLGGALDDAAGGAAVAADGTLLVAARLPGHDPGGVASTDLLGGGDGALTRLDASGRQVLQTVRLGDALVDLDLAADGRVAVAAQGLGLVLLAADLGTVAWHDPLPDAVRVATGGDGTALSVAVLTAGRTVRVLDGAGGLRGTRSFGDSVVADVTVAPDGQRVVVTGFNNRTTSGGTPVQVPFVRAFDPTLTTQLWRAYDWTADQVAAQDNSLADCRGVRVAFGADDFLYFAGRTDGGNTTFRFDPLVIDRRLPSDELVSYDPFSNTAGISGSFAITVFGRFEPATGDVLKLQLLLARLSSGNGNTVVPAAIMADASGRVFVGGRAFASIQERDQQRIAGQPVGPYQSGEAFLLAVDPDFLAREVWTVFTAPGGTQNTSVVGVAERAGRVAWSIDVANDTARLLTVDALQPTRDVGTSAYLATRLWTLFGDGFESGDLGAWSASVP
ncbi:MAG: hypothetical protein AAGC60_11020 [Acidobacteriota bacterium]